MIEASFLDAIFAAPDDDAPRLIYADWLEEQTSASDRARAEFIRVQIELDRLLGSKPVAGPLSFLRLDRHLKTSTTESARELELTERSQSLLKAYAASWLPASRNKRECFWRRGFVQRVLYPIGTGQAVPVRDLPNFPLTEVAAVEVIESQSAPPLPVMPNAWGLMVRCDDTLSLERNASHYFANLPAWPRLESLSVEQRGFRPAGVSQWAPSNALKEVDVTRSPLSAADVDCLAGMPNLEALGFRYMQVSSTTFTLAALPRLRRLSIRSDFEFPSADLPQFLAGRSLDVLHVTATSTPADDQVIRQLFDIPPPRVLHLDRFGIDEAPMEELHRRLNPEALWLSGQRIA